MPEVKADIYGVIGSTYDNLGLAYDAEIYLRLAMEIRESDVPLDDAKLGQLYFDFARNALKRCDARAACKTGKLALDALARANTPPDPKLIEVYQQANDIIDVGNTMKARKRAFQHHKVVYETVIPEFSKLERETPERLSGMFLTHGLFLLLDVGEYEMAARLCRSARDALDAGFSINERNGAATDNGTLALIYRQHGMHEAAQSLYASLRTDADGNAEWFRNNPWQLMIVADTLLHDETSTCEDRKKALNLSRRFFPLAMSSATPEIRAMATLSLARAQTSNGLTDAAELTLRQSLNAIPMASLFARGMLEQELAGLLEQQGAIEQAGVVLRHAMDWRRKCPDDKHYSAQIALAERNLALFLLRNDRETLADEARSLLETAQRRIRSYPPGNFYRDTVDAALAELARNNS